MKRAISISLGSSKRDSTVELDLLGQRVCIERRGTDGDMARAAALYSELDGKVDAFGVGGTDLGLTVDNKYYTLHSVAPLVRGVRRTPIVDGSGLKNTLERQVAPYMDAHIGGAALQPRRVLMTSGADRWGMSMSFMDKGVFGDLMFGLGLPLPLRSAAAIKRVAALILPIVSRLPFEWLYPTGEKQEKNTPKFGQWYDWATVIAGDCHFIKRFMPARLDQHDDRRRRGRLPRRRRALSGDDHATAGRPLLWHEHDGGDAGGRQWPGAEVDRRRVERTDRATRLPSQHRAVKRLERNHR